MQHSSDESREQKLQKSLSNFDTTLLLTDLKQLNLYGPRDTSRYYEHRTRPLYLQHKTIHVITPLRIFNAHGSVTLPLESPTNVDDLIRQRCINDTEKYTVQHEWTDITQKYNWENLLDNMDEPIYKFETNQDK